MYRTRSRRSILLSSKTTPHRGLRTFPSRGSQHRIFCEEEAKKNFFPVFVEDLSYRTTPDDFEPFDIANNDLNSSFTFHDPEPTFLHIFEPKTQQYRHYRGNVSRICALTKLRERNDPQEDFLEQFLLEKLGDDLEKDKQELVHMPSFYRRALPGDVPEGIIDLIKGINDDLEPIIWEAADFLLNTPSVQSMRTEDF